MALQDLTPELRTRLGNVERWVGVFLCFASLLLLSGLGYYLYQTGKRKGWFLTKVPYHTYLQDATGLAVGQKVKLMGFDVGQITEIEAMGPYDYYNVFLKFEILEPYYGYLWTDSRVRVVSENLLGSRFLEVTKGTNGASTVELENGQIEEVRGVLDLLIKTNADQVPLANLRYVPLTNGSKGFWLTVDEAPSLTTRLQGVVDTVEAALPGFLQLTNQLKAALGKVEDIATHADALLVSAQPTMTNFQVISSQLAAGPGALGQWLLPSNLTHQLEGTLASGDAALISARTNLAALSTGLLRSLDNLANLTSNLNAQVQNNGFILNEISMLVADTDTLVQGLKRHWLLKGAFAPSSNAPPSTLLEPRLDLSP